MSLKKWLMAGAVAMLLGGGEALAVPAGQITEIFFNPPDGEATREYFEVNITSYDSGYTYWFVALENEDGNNSDPGQVDLAYQLAGVSSAGYKWYNPSGTHCHGPSNGNYGTELEGSGASYLLIAVANGATTPAAAGANWDDETTNGQLAKNGVLDSNIKTLIDDADWIILDSVACVGESPEANAGTYQAQYTFSAIDPATAAFLAGTVVRSNPAGAATFGKHAEIEYLGRTAQGTWFAANLSKNADASYSDCNWGVSGNSSNPECVSTCLDNPYDFPQIITNSFGSATTNTTDNSCP